MRNGGHVTPRWRRLPQPCGCRWLGPIQGGAGDDGDLAVESSHGVLQSWDNTRLCRNAGRAGLTCLKRPQIYASGASAPVLQSGGPTAIDPDQIATRGMVDSSRIAQSTSIWKETTLASDPLQFGQLLLGKRARLKRFGSALSADADLVDRAICCALCEGWHSRSQIENERELDRLLSVDLQEKIRSGPGPCGSRWPVCARFSESSGDGLGSALS